MGFPVGGDRQLGYDQGSGAYDRKTNPISALSTTVDGSPVAVTRQSAEEAHLKGTGEQRARGPRRALRVLGVPGLDQKPWLVTVKSLPNSQADSQETPAEANAAMKAVGQKGFPEVAVRRGW